MALKGIKVIEMAGLAPVPYCGMILSDFGARVIRVNRPGEANFDKLGRGKESICINLKKTEGVDIVKRLCEKADVLLEPYRPGVMEKLGLGPDVLSSTNPKLVYARLTGYGQTGPMSLKAGHDINYIATSGVLSKLGRRDERPEPPINLLADFAGGGLVCALGIVMALYERSISGKGQVIDANMVEGSAYVASWLDAGKSLLFHDKKGHNLLDGGSAFYDTYTTKDGKYMAVGALEPKFYMDLLKGLGLDDSKVSQGDDQDEQRKLFQEIFLTKTQEEWTQVFDQLEACVTPILTVEEAAKLPHNAQKNTFLEGQGLELQGGPAPRLSRTPGVHQPQKMPKIGEHTLDILSELGLSQSEIKKIVECGAIPQTAKL